MKGHDFLEDCARPERRTDCRIRAPFNRGKAIAMRKIILAVCCATLTSFGPAAAQTYGTPPAQNTTPNSSSPSHHVMSKGKTAKGKTTKHKTVGMSKGSKAKSDMKQDDTAK
jgi:hypothetical protein